MCALASELYSYNDVILILRSDLWKDDRQNFASGSRLRDKCLQVQDTS